MSEPVVVQPEDIGQERLQELYEDAGLETSVDSDGDLVVMGPVTCYAAPTQTCDRIQLMAFVGIREEAQRDARMEFVNRVNNQVSTVRARVNPKGRVLFDYHIPVEGGTTERAIVMATQFFLQATAYAANNCDEDDIVR